jgi:cardiolipin synthase C
MSRTVRMHRQARWAIVGLALLLSACASSLRNDFTKTPSTALAPAADTPASSRIEALAAAHDGESGFHLLTDGTAALAARVIMADAAVHSLDVQYYIFANDETGRLVAQRLLAAADRGVRVRLLLDDIQVLGKDKVLTALDAHPNIEVRVYNPFMGRGGTVSKGFQFLGDSDRLNRRMHNKSFTVDNRMSIIGGRNIADEYFDASEGANFRDLDVAAIGPVVPEISASFDTYWNSDAAYPITAFKDNVATEEEMKRLRGTLAEKVRQFATTPYAMGAIAAVREALTAPTGVEWLWGSTQLAVDTPEKSEAGGVEHSLLIGASVRPMFESSRNELILISPYFIPGDSGVKLLSDVHARGVKVRVLTNSLATNDVGAVHSGYAKYREPLLAAGIEIHELRPQEGTRTQAKWAASHVVALHAKAMIGDDHIVFVGSMNLDPRSRVLNTEMGVIVDSVALATQVRAFYESAVSPKNSYRLELVAPPDGKGSKHLEWVTEVNGVETRYTDEPDVSGWRRFKASFAKILPIEGML